MSAPRIHVIGVAPGCRQLDEQARELLAGAGLVVSAARHLPLVEGAGFTGEVMEVEWRVGEAVARVVADPSLHAVFLASGDPGFFGVAVLLQRKLPPEQVAVLPAVSSMQLAFARAGVSWSDARFASLHGRKIETLAPVLGAPKVGLFTDPTNTPATIAQFLVDAGWDDLEMVVCAELGLEGEKVERGPVRQFTDWAGSALNVVILLRTGDDLRPLGPGLADDRFAHPRGRITKAAVRATALGLLELPRAGVLWDVGAGSGSVSIEATLLCPALRVYAVERDEEAVGHVRENRKRFRAAGLTVVPGAAPAALAGLPDPDRVFIGGSGGALHDILDPIFQRLSPGGVVVVSTVLAETFAAALEWGRRAAREPEWLEIGVSRSRPTGAGTRRVAENPVTLIKFRKEEVPS